MDKNARIAALESALRAARREHHTESAGGHCPDNPGYIERHGKEHGWCDCGAWEHNSAIDAALAGSGEDGTAQPFTASTAPGEVHVGRASIFEVKGAGGEAGKPLTRAFLDNLPSGSVAAGCRCGAAWGAGYERKKEWHKEGCEEGKQEPRIAVSVGSGAEPGAATGMKARKLSPTAGDGAVTFVDSTGAGGGTAGDGVVVSLAPIDPIAVARAAVDEAARTAEAVEPEVDYRMGPDGEEYPVTDTRATMSMAVGAIRAIDPAAIVAKVRG